MKAHEMWAEGDMPHKTIELLTVTRRTADYVKNLIRKLDEGVLPTLPASETKISDHLKELSDFYEASIAQQLDRLEELFRSIYRSKDKNRLNEFDELGLDCNQLLTILLQKHETFIFFLDENFNSYMKKSEYQPHIEIAIEFAVNYLRENYYGLSKYKIDAYNAKIISACLAALNKNMQTLSVHFQGVTEHLKKFPDYHSLQA